MITGMEMERILNETAMIEGCRNEYLCSPKFYKYLEQGLQDFIGDRRYKLITAAGSNHSGLLQFMRLRYRFIWDFNKKEFRVDGVYKPL